MTVGRGGADSGGFQMLWFRRLAKITTPFAENLYRVVLLLDSLNPALETHVVRPASNLKRLRISSIAERILMEGDYRLREDSVARSFGYDEVTFRVELAVTGTEGNNVVLRVVKLRVHDSAGGGLDMLRLVSKFVRRARREIIRTFAERIPHIVTPRRDFSELLFHADYFLAKVPSFSGSLGEVRILTVRPADDNRVHFFVHSNLILMNLVQTFGPEYLQLEEVHLEQEQESQAFLWDLFRG